MQIHSSNAIIDLQSSAEAFKCRWLICSSCLWTSVCSLVVMDRHILGITNALKWEQGLVRNTGQGSQKFKSWVGCCFFLFPVSGRNSDYNYFTLLLLVDLWLCLKAWSKSSLGQIYTMCDFSFYLVNHLSPHLQFWISAIITSIFIRIYLYWPVA